MQRHINSYRKNELSKVMLLASFCAIFSNIWAASSLNVTRALKLARAVKNPGQVAPVGNKFVPSSSALTQLLVGHKLNEPSTSNPITTTLTGPYNLFTEINNVSQSITFENGDYVIFALSTSNLAQAKYSNVISVPVGANVTKGSLGGAGSTEATAYWFDYTAFSDLENAVKSLSGNGYVALKYNPNTQSVDLFTGTFTAPAQGTTSASTTQTLIGSFKLGQKGTWAKVPNLPAKYQMIYVIDGQQNTKIFNQEDYIVFATNQNLVKDAIVVNNNTKLPSIGFGPIGSTRDNYYWFAGWSYLVANLPKLSDNQYIALKYNPTSTDNKFDMYQGTGMPPKSTTVSTLTTKPTAQPRPIGKNVVALSGVSTDPNNGVNSPNGFGVQLYDGSSIANGQSIALTDWNIPVSDGIRARIDENKEFYISVQMKKDGASNFYAIFTVYDLSGTSLVPTSYVGQYVVVWGVNTKLNELSVEEIPSTAIPLELGAVEISNDNVWKTLYMDENGIGWLHFVPKLFTNLTKVSLSQSNLYPNTESYGSSTQISTKLNPPFNMFYAIDNAWNTVAFTDYVIFALSTANIEEDNNVVLVSKGTQLTYVQFGGSGSTKDSNSYSWNGFVELNTQLEALTDNTYIALQYNPSNNGVDLYTGTLG